MTILDQSPPGRRTTAAIVAAGALVLASLVVTLPVGAEPLRELTLDKTTAVSNADQGDHIQVSGSGCTPDVGNLINVLLFKGAFGPAEVPPIPNLQGSGYSPDSAGNWTGSFPIPGGAGALTPGQYTIRAACYPEGSGTAAFWYANVVITITDGSVTPTSPPEPDSTVSPPTTVPGQPVTTKASPAAQAGVAAHPAFTG